MTGYSEDELIGMDGLLLITKQSRHDAIKNISLGYEKQYEVVGLRKNGTEYPLQLESRNIPYKRKMVRTVEFRDITEQKKSEEALKESEGKLKSVFNNMVDVLWSSSYPDFKPILISKSTENLYGYTADLFLNNTIELNSLTHPEDKQSFENAILELKRTGKATRECSL